MADEEPVGVVAIDTDAQDTAKDPVEQAEPVSGKHKKHKHKEKDKKHKHKKGKSKDKRHAESDAQPAEAPQVRSSSRASLRFAPSSVSDPLLLPSPARPCARGALRP